MLFKVNSKWNGIQNEKYHKTHTKQFFFFNKNEIKHKNYNDKMNEGVHFTYKV